MPGAQLVGVRRVGQALLHVARRRSRGDGRGGGEMMPHLAGETLTTTNLNNPPGTIENSQFEQPLSFEVKRREKAGKYESNASWNKQS